MRNFLFFALATVLFTACNNEAKTARTFCDTACNSDSITFRGHDKWEGSLDIKIKDCEPDSVSWTYKGLPSERQIPFKQYVNKTVRMNKSAVGADFQDTTAAWLAFNDCFTGRGYLFKLPFRKGNQITTISSALNSFDPKFSVAQGLRAYTDKGNIYVVDVANGKEAQMTFKEEYKMDFNDIHKSVDTIHVTRERVYVRLLKDGQPVEFEKKISL